MIQPCWSTLVPSRINSFEQVAAMLATKAVGKSDSAAADAAKF
jgi:hypothetical protein